MHTIFYANFLLKKSVYFLYSTVLHKAPSHFLLFFSLLHGQRAPLQTHLKTELLYVILYLFTDQLILTVVDCFLYILPVQQQKSQFFEFKFLIKKKLNTMQGCRGSLHSLPVDLYLITLFSHCAGVCRGGHCCSGLYWFPSNASYSQVWRKLQIWHQR